MSDNEITQILMFDSIQSLILANISSIFNLLVLILKFYDFSYCYLIRFNIKRNLKYSELIFTIPIELINNIINNI